MKEELIAIILAIFIMVGISIAVVGLDYWSDVQSCNQRWSQFEHRQEGFWARCQIKVGDKWIPSNAYREIEK